jgi:phospholipase C
MNVYRSRSMTTVLGSGRHRFEELVVVGDGGWYDLIITVDGDPHFEYGLAGHLEDGEDSISDPAMDGLV